MIYDKALMEAACLGNHITSLKKQINMLPPGELQVFRNGKYIKWYVCYGKNRVYLPKKEWEHATQLAKKKHLQTQLINAEKEKRAIEYYLRHHDKDALQKELEFLNSDLYKNLLPSTYLPKSKELEAWMNAPYDRNMSYPDHLIHDTFAGHKVRSKSEAIISTFLTKNLIPYRYECCLQLRDIYVYPDFTIRHPETGKTFYWEHFGLVDNPDYLNKFIEKIKLYISCGILPGNQLIITTETREQPLSQELVEKLIKQYFLD